MTNKRFPGNPTQSYRTHHPVRVAAELQSCRAGKATTPTCSKACWTTSRSSGSRGSTSSRTSADIPRRVRHSAAYDSQALPPQRPGFEREETAGFLATVFQNQERRCALPRSTATNARGVGPAGQQSSVRAVGAQTATAQAIHGILGASDLSATSWLENRTVINTFESSRCCDDRANPRFPLRASSWPLLPGPDVSVAVRRAACRSPRL